ncbi:MAG: FkbM family methyltransferase, partial [Anaerolineales bacterium]
VLVSKAVGRQPGRAQLHVSTRTPTVSTLSAEWAGEVAQTPGFANVAWDTQMDAEVTTLDELIAQFGLPVFCKIDVEGSEPDALFGLNQPIAALSLEYIPAALDRTMICLEHLKHLGDYRYNLVEGERPHFSLEGWVGKETVAARLQSLTQTARAGELFAITIASNPSLHSG